MPELWGGYFDYEKWNKQKKIATAELLAHGWPKPLPNSTYEYKFNSARDKRARKVRI